MSTIPKPSMTTPEGRAALGFGWQDTGPVLPNLSPSAPHRHYWTAVETIVWIATRSLDCVGGARTFLHDGVDPLERPSLDDRLDPFSDDVAAQVLLTVHLKSDLAGHHPACSQKTDGESCTCDVLDRKRFCRCNNAEQTTIFTCSCIDRARESLFDALVAGLAATGLRDGRTVYEEIKPAAFAGAKPAFREGDGLSIIPEYRNIRILRSEIEQRWPADPKPVPSAAAAKSDPATEEDMFARLDDLVAEDTADIDELAELLSGPAFKGRPHDYAQGLQLFMDRLLAGSVVGLKITEAVAISKLHPKHPNKTTVAKWLKPYFKTIIWDKGKVTNGEAVAAIVRSGLIKQLRQKIGDTTP